MAASAWPLVVDDHQGVASSGGARHRGVSAWATAAATSSRAVRVLKFGLTGWMGLAILLQREPRRLRARGAQALDQRVELADGRDRSGANAEQAAAIHARLGDRDAVDAGRTQARGQALGIVRFGERAGLGEEPVGCRRRRCGFAGGQALTSTRRSRSGPCRGPRAARDRSMMRSSQRPASFRGSRRSARSAGCHAHPGGSGSVGVRPTARSCCRSRRSRCGRRGSRGRTGGDALST